MRERDCPPLSCADSLSPCSEAEAGELSDPRPAPATLPDRHSNPWLHSGPLLLLGSGASQPARLGSGGEEDSEASQGEQEVNFDPSIHLIEEPADGVGQSSDVTACPSTKNKSRLGKNNQVMSLPPRDSQNQTRNNRVTSLPPTLTPRPTCGQRKRLAYWTWPASSS